MKAIRKGVFVKTRYNGTVVILKVVKKMGNDFETYAPITYCDGSVHYCKVALPVSNVIEVM